MKIKLTILALLYLANSSFIYSQDKLAQLRTNKKIISMSEAVAPYYAIQIIALKLPPNDPLFFTNVETAREYPCADGFLRFCVGGYSSYNEALSDLDRVKQLGYEQAFVVNTKNFYLSKSSGTSSKGLVIDVNKTYTVQLSAFRYPVYLSHFEGLEGVMEFRMKDKIFKYTVGKYIGNEAEAGLAEIKSKGYPDAFLVELDSYMPYKIE